MHKRIAVLIAVVLSAAAAEAASLPSRKYENVLIPDVPHVKQKPDFCGEACAEMYLRKLGCEVDQDYVFDESGLDPLLARGCYTSELVRALRAIGFDVGRVWYSVAAGDTADMEQQWRQLYDDLADGVPSIVCMHYDDRPGTTEHFRLILGYDAAADAVIFHEPAVENGSYRTMARPLFLKLWPLQYDTRRYTIIRIRLQPDHLKKIRSDGKLSDADYVQHMMKLNRLIPTDTGFTKVIVHPFVVIGDEEPEVVKKRAEGTVKWAVEKLKQDFFDKDPDEILDIWLFKNKTSYRKYTREIFNDNPSTPFGYYSAKHGALIMNIATGGGTLVHEIVHPFMRANFPQCPAWLNEGMGSLYEQCGERGGHIRGFTNWRLAGLQKAIKADRIASLKQLTGTTDTQFYGRNSGINYAQARYLCYYLQEKDLLVEFYKQFNANHKDDPTGYETLKDVLNKDDDEMKAFQKEWENYVLKLTFP